MNLANELSEEERKRRAKLAQAVLDIHRALLHYNDSAALTITTLAVSLNWYLNLRLDISGLAELTGMPRQTVTRHLSTLEDAGFLQLSRSHRWVYPIKTRKKNAPLSELYDEVEAVFARFG